jgi:hypothetical protein
VLLVVVSSYNLEKFYTLSERVLRYDGSRTTSLRQQGDEMISSPSNLRTTTGDSRNIHDLCDPYNLRDQLC